MPIGDENNYSQLQLQLQVDRLFSYVLFLAHPVYNFILSKVDNSKKLRAFNVHPSIKSIFENGSDG